MIVLVAWGSQDLKRQVSNDGWGPLVQEKEFPLQGEPGHELSLLGRHDGKLSHKLKRREELLLLKHTL